MSNAIIDAKHALDEIVTSSRWSTLVWMTRLGQAVAGRDAGQTLAQFRQALEQAGARPTSSSYLSRAATVYEALVDRHHGFENDDLRLEIATHPVAEIYRAACAVRDGELADDLTVVLQALRDGRFKGKPTNRNNKDDAPGAGGDEEAPAPEVVDPEVLAVYEAACAGAEAAGQPVLEWVRQQAAAAILGA